MSTFLALTTFQTGDLASQAGLVATSGVLQAAIDAGGGGAPAAANYVYQTGDQLITGSKSFIASVVGGGSAAAFGITTNWTGITNITGPTSKILGMSAVVNLAGSGSITSSLGAISVQAAITQSTYTGVCNQQTLLLADAPSLGNAIVGNHRGLWVRGSTSNFNLNNFYGAYIDNNTSATGNNYSIFSQGGMNVFSGALGIGAVGTGADPSAALHVSGFSKFDGEIRTPFLSTASSILSLGLNSNSVTGFISTSTQGNGSVRFGSLSDHDIVFRTAGLTKMTILANGGYVGIGQTTPLVPLHVTGSAILAEAGGSVGIGTSTPQALLHVAGGIQISGGPAYSIFSQGGMNVFSGAVGIGNVGTGADPAVNLHVAGPTQAQRYDIDPDNWPVVVGAKNNSVGQGAANLGFTLVGIGNSGNFTGVGNLILGYAHTYQPAANRVPTNNVIVGNRNVYHTSGVSTEDSTNSLIGTQNQFISYSGRGHVGNSLVGTLNTVIQGGTGAASSSLVRFNSIMGYSNALTSETRAESISIFGNGNTIFTTGVNAFGSFSLLGAANQIFSYSGSPVQNACVGSQNIISSTGTMLQTTVIGSLNQISNPRFITVVGSNLISSLQTGVLIGIGDTSMFMASGIGLGIGLGATTPPTATLHVSGTLRTDLVTATTANAGGATLPANPVGFITINITGGNFKIPYYNV